MQESLCCFKDLSLVESISSLPHKQRKSTFYLFHETPLETYRFFAVSWEMKPKLTEDTLPYRLTKGLLSWRGYTMTMEEEDDDGFTDFGEPNEDDDDTQFLIPPDSYEMTHGATRP